MYKVIKGLAKSNLVSRNLFKKGPWSKNRSTTVANKEVHLREISLKPLSEPLEGYENLSYIDPNKSTDCQPFTAKQTVLGNGLRVVTEPSFGEYCTVGVAINSGSRFEAGYPQGTCHFLEKLAFLSQPDTEQHGAIVECQGSKDVFFYASSCHKNVADIMIKLISDEVLRPKINDETVKLSGSLIKYENEALIRSTECEPLLTDYIHQAAFRNNTFGLPRYCKSENIELIRPQHLFSFLKQYFTPDRIVLGGVGIDHDYLVSTAEQYFDEKDAVWSMNSSLLLKSEPALDNSIAQYTGGEYKVVRDLSNMAPGPSPFPNLAHLMLGFEGASLSDEDFVAFNVVQTLLGGGYSFSSGGPGKGMFTRLYTNVLHHCNYMYNATASNFSYADSGLFCIRASASPNKMNKVPEIILSELIKLAKGVEDEELNRAKAQLKSNMMMSLEMRPVMFENLVRQSLFQKEIRRPQYYADKIDHVQNKDIIHVLRKMLDSKLSVAAYGDLTVLPTYERIRSLI